MGIEKGKKGKTLVNFVCGNRIFKMLDFAVLEHQAGLTKVLKGGPTAHVEKAANLMSRMTLAEKGLKNNLMDLAKLEAANFNKQIIENKNLVFDRHNKDGSNDFLIVMGNALDKNVSAFMSIGDEKIKNNTFMFVCLSPKIEEISKQVLELIEGKGAAKNNKLQGKCSSLKKRKQVVALLESVMDKVE